MEKTITINSKEYKIPEFNFETICELEDLGINFQDISEKSFSFIRGLVAYTTKKTLKNASQEIENHIENGGKLEDFVPLYEAVTNSSFFQNIAKKR